MSVSSKYNKSETLLEEISKRSCEKFSQIDSKIDEELLRAIWSGFGIYVLRHLKMGRGVTIPKLGIFTFTARMCDMAGVTNPDQREVAIREPVFLIAKEFVPGKDIKSAIFSSSSNELRPYTNFGMNGNIPLSKVNYSEIAQYSKLTKDMAKFCLDRVVRDMSERARNNEKIDMDIPAIGTLMIRNTIAGIAFEESVRVMIQNAAASYIPLSAKKRNGEMTITKEKLREFDIYKSLDNLALAKQNEDRLLEVDPKAREFLLKSMDINVDTDLQRPRTENQRRRVNNFFMDQYNPAGVRSSLEMRGESIGSVRAKTPQLRESSSDKALSTNLHLNLGELEGSKRLRYWLRGSSFSEEDSFIYLCKISNGVCNNKSKLTKANFTSALLKLGIILEENQANELFLALDIDKDGLINISDWRAFSKRLDDTYENHLQYIKDVIFRNNLYRDDILKKMNINKETILSCAELNAVLRRLDETLNVEKAMGIAKLILKGKEFIDVEDLVKELECQPEEVLSSRDETWFKDILIRIKKQLIVAQDSNILKKLFENYDDSKKGLLNLANFQTCLLKAQLKLSVGDINRLARYVDKEDFSTIDYVKFLQRIENSYKPLKDHQTFADITQFAERLKKELAKHKMSIALFLKKIAVAQGFSVSNTDISVPCKAVVQYFLDKLFLMTSYKEISEYVECIDIDKDNIISEIDLETFLKRYQYIDENVKLNEQLGKNSSLSESRVPYPTVPLADNKIDFILKDVKETMLRKNISASDLYKILDGNQDGLITIDEFSENLDKFIKFAQPLKEKFFSYLDKHKMGIISYDVFLETINRSLFTRNPVVSEDNWNWQHEILEKIRNWKKSEKLSFEDAFKILDKDFDGNISKLDLKLFLLEVLHIEEKEVTSQRIDRLFRLIDQFKRGLVQLFDFKRVLINGSDHSISLRRSVTSLNMKVAEKVALEKEVSQEWIMNAKQQVGLVLSRNFDSLHASFESISGHTNRLLYSHFTRWVEKNRALIGFNLTDKLMQEFYAHLDPHKKGFLSEKDWINTFTGYDWVKQMVKEISETLSINFNSPEDSFNFFTRGTKIDLESIKKGLNSLLPLRFTPGDIKTIWDFITKGLDNAIIDYPKYLEIFYDSKASTRKSNILESNQDNLKSLKRLFEGTKREKALSDYDRKATNYNNLLSNSNTSIFQDNEEEKNIVEKVRQILKASKLKIEDVFKEIDKCGTGIISNLEFRNAFRKMNAGLTSKDLDLLINRCEKTNDGKINWKDFLGSFSIGDLGKRLIERSKLRLLKIREAIYSFMLSPKDAFRSANESRNGMMTFAEFHAFIKTLCQLSRDKLYPYSIIKDLFECLDIRKDGVIDINEWLQSFRLLDTVENNPYTAPGTARPKTSINFDATPQVLKRKCSTSSIKKRHHDSESLPKLTTPKEDDFGVVAKEEKFTGSSALSEKEIKNSTNWQVSRDYDEIIKIIGKNRKFITNKFTEMQKSNIPINFNNVKMVLQNLIRNAGLNIEDEFWAYLLKFADKNGIIDYQFLLEVYKERYSRVESHPQRPIIKMN